MLLKVEKFKEIKYKNTSYSGSTEVRTDWYESLPCFVKIDS